MARDDLTVAVGLELACWDVAEFADFPVPLPIQEAYVAKVQELGGEVPVRKDDKDDHCSLCGTALPAAKEWIESLRAKEWRPPAPNVLPDFSERREE